jgi:O-antigen ligase
MAATARPSLLEVENWLLLAVLALLALGVGIAVARDNLLIALLPLAILAVFLVFRLNYNSFILVLCLYAGLASNTYSIIYFHGKTLTLSAGDLGMIAVTGLMLFWIVAETAIRREAVFSLPTEARPFLLPLGLLAVLFLCSSLWAGIGPLASQNNLSQSLLAYSHWLIGPVMLLFLANASVKPARFPDIVALLAAVFSGGYLVAVLTGQKQVETVITGGLNPFMRISGVFSDPNEMGQIAVLLLVVLAAFTLTAPRKSRRNIVWLLVAALAAMVFLTQSREAIIALLVSASTLGFVLARRNRKLAAALLVVLLGLSIVLLLRIPRVASTLTDIRSGAAITALNGRDEVWRGSWGVISSHPVTGIGFENLLVLTNGTIQDAHNGFMQSMVVSGVLGLLAYIWLVWNTGRYLFRYSRETDGTVRAIFVAMFCAFVGYIVTALVSDHFITFYVYSTLFWGTTGLALAALRSARLEGTELEGPKDGSVASNKIEDG